MNRRLRGLVAVHFLLVCFVFGLAQTSGAQTTLVNDLRELVQTPAVPGYEQQLSAKIAGELKSFAPKIDAQNNVTVTIGKGTPHRLIVASIDEPGFVASGITSEGYLTLQRLPQAGNLPLFNELYSAQPVLIGTAQNTWIHGAVAGLSVHLQPQRQHPPAASDLDNMFVDVGATTATEARAGGADVLSPVALERKFYEMGFGKWTAAAIGDRFGAAVLLEVLRNADPANVKGTLTFAFVTQQWVGARGLQRLLYRLTPDEVIYVGRLVRAPVTPGQREAAPVFKESPGSGVLVASEKPDAELAGLPAELKQLAAQNNIPLKTDYSASLFPRGGYMLQPKMPERSVHLAVATSWPSTPGEIVQGHDVMAMTSLLETYLFGRSKPMELSGAAPLSEPTVSAKPKAAPSTEEIIKQLIETYAVSSHEENMRRAVTQLLPPWAKPETDNGGNLVLHWPSPKGGSGPRIVVVAHMDEIGYEVRSVAADGRLELESKGGGVLAYFLGHAGLVHSANGMHPGVLELPDGWEKLDFQWPRGLRQTFRMDVGAQTPEQVSDMGIKAGDFVTIPKQYHKLLHNFASARAFDDRVGCASLVAATWALGQNPNQAGGTTKDSASPGGRDITFIWSTREELGLEGAADAAKNMASEVPDYVFAIDTFVSSDSPLESKRFGNAILGHGFVVRAVDNSNIVPRNLTQKVVSIARSSNVPVQYGVTGGGNDGAAFLLYGSTDVALGWPLRYSHSPGEVIDLRDLDALARIVTAIARRW
ncbi:MAG TPA: peptidase M42 [Candidatus Angelobacter sp.]|nr:peptidase M42 [Candidatus Angelobacter sp.]